MTLFTRGAKLYSAEDKLEAIDEFGKYLSNSNSMYKELVKPIISGKAKRDIHLKMVASQIKWNMLWEANTQDGKIYVTGKPKYYPMGKWTQRRNGKGDVFHVLELDLRGEDKDIFDKDYLEKRVEKYLSMGNETNLLRNLKKLGYEVRGSSDVEDKIKKADLVAVGKLNESVGISVYKSSDRTALEKLKISNIADFKVRLAYNVFKYGKPSDITNVRKWVEDCNKGGNRIIIKSDGTKFITKTKRE